MVDLKPEKKEEDWVFINEHAIGLYHSDEYITIFSHRVRTKKNERIKYPH